MIVHPSDNNYSIQNFRENFAELLQPVPVYKRRLDERELGPRTEYELPIGGLSVVGSLATQGDYVSRTEQIYDFCVTKRVPQVFAKKLGALASLANQNIDFAGRFMTFTGELDPQGLHDKVAVDLARHNNKPFLQNLLGGVTIVDVAPKSLKN